MHSSRITRPQVATSAKAARRGGVSRLVRTLLLPMGALVLAGGLSGCVAYPAYPGYGYGYGGGYGYGPAYAYAPAPVVVGGGWGWGGGWHDHDHGGWNRGRGW